MSPLEQWQLRSCGVEPSGRPESSTRGSPSWAQPAPIPPHPPLPPDRAQRQLLRSARPVVPLKPQSARGRGARELPRGLSDRGRDFPHLCPATGIASFHRGAGPGLGAGRRAGGRGAISSLARGFARTSLGALPAREPDPVAPRGRDRTGRWRQRQGDAPGAEDPIGARRRNLSRALRSPTLRRSPTPRTLDYTGKETQPGPNWGGDPSCFPRAREGRFSRRREPRRTGGTLGLESAGCAR